MNKGINGEIKMNVPPTIKILKITMVLRIIERDIEIFLNFWNRFKMISNLKTLHV
jgi:hypothetical protein